MRVSLVLLLITLLLACQSAAYRAGTSQKVIAPQPLYRDPTFDGAADPLVIWNRQTHSWYMFYTNRRANLESSEGVEWVHGSPIGIAESADGANWQYRSDAMINYPFGVERAKNPTYWAPDIIYDQEHYHMFLTIVPGIFKDWRHPRSIVHFISDDLLNWDYVDTLKLNSQRVIDAEVIALPQGGYRLFYNNEADGKSLYYADSSDLFRWHDQGKVALQSRGEGPTAFSWQGYWWIVLDAWKGLSVFRSQDLEHWENQPNRLLEKPGTGKDDGVIGGHPDVVVNEGKAYLFYFTHPGRTPNNQGVDTHLTRRSVIQVTELSIEDGWLVTDRNQPSKMNFSPSN